MLENLLEVNHLSISFLTSHKELEAVKDVSFTVKKGQTLGIVGESGSGKSVTAKAIMQLLQSPPAIIKDGEIIFNQKNLLDLSDKEMEHVRGKEIGMIFQDPMTSTNPTIRIGDQIAESLMKHQSLSKAQTREKTIQLLSEVGIHNPSERYNQYPYEFSGGMRQRAMIAMALACNPELLIADEPTTALDVTIQAQILRLMHDMKKQLNTSIILITHDLGVVAGMCDYLIVMKEGEIVERGTTEEIFANAQHPYTQKLLNALPKLNEKKAPKQPIIFPPDIDTSKPLIEVKQLVKTFNAATDKAINAVDNISFTIAPGETLGLVGESGSGKSTTGRTLLQLHEPTSGEVLYQGIAIDQLTKKQLKTMRKHVQIIFQDPYSSLNPRRKILDIIGEALDIHKLVKNKKERTARVEALLELVGLQKEHAMRYPHEFSGGQRQRIGIARALAVEPKFIVCDEPLSALDVSIQKQIVTLLKELQHKLGLTYLFIAHDLSMVKHISDRVAVMYKGKIVELAESEELYANPQHAYTKKLLQAIPIPDPAIEKAKYQASKPPLQEVYDVSTSELVEVSPAHWVAIAK